MFLVQIVLTYYLVFSLCGILLNIHIIRSLYLLDSVESGQRAQKLLQEILTQDAQLNPSTDSDTSASTVPKFDLTQVPSNTIAVADNAPETKRARVDESAISSVQLVENSGGDPNSALEYTTERVDLGYLFD